MGRLSAAARTTPERDRLKAEAIRMHVELDFGINAIEPRIGINKTAIRRWLIAAGCYRAGHRTRQAKNDGAKLIDCRPTDLGRKQIYVHVWQRRAWLDEWKGVAKWDAAKHWHRHPAKQLYINAQTARKSARLPFSRFVACQTNLTVGNVHQKQRGLFPRNPQHNQDEGRSHADYRVKEFAGGRHFASFKEIRKHAQHSQTGSNKK